ERDRVAEAGPARVLGAREEARRSLVREPGTHPRVRQAGDDREVLAELPEHVQVRRELVILALLLREEEFRVQAERRADADHAPLCRCGRSAERARGHEVTEAGQGQRHAGGAQEFAAVQWHGEILAGWSFVPEQSWAVRNRTVTSAGTPGSARP